MRFLSWQSLGGVFAIVGLCLTLGINPASPSAKRGQPDWHDIGGATTLPIVLNAEAGLSPADIADSYEEDGVGR